jgi:mono/diheme cytochrome c family protein
MTQGEHRDGRNGKMPAWEPIIGKAGARLVAAWVLAQASPAETTPEKP